jgi:NTE family protein
MGGSRRAGALRPEGDSSPALRGAGRPKRTPGRVRRLATAAIALPLLVATSTDASGAEEPAPGPRVGLVLSGGGARGFAHVGVLEVLEELRIPVDVIAGTSMGAVVGGLYAQGLSPRELVSVVEDIDWTTAFHDQPPRRELSFRRKRDDFDFLTNLRLYIKDWKIALPRGLIEGQKITNILGELTLPAATVRDFDALPIPFRAVATDANTGEAVILGDGDLARALRASMAIPGIFSPVEIDDRLLVDGGVSKNLPVDVARDLGADIVIAVDIGTSPADSAAVKSAFSIGGQTLTVLMYRNTREQIDLLGADDVLIRPDMAGITTASFEKGREGIAQGAAAAREMASGLTRLSVSRVAFDAYLERRAAVPRAPPVIDSVRLDNRSALDDRVIQKRLHTQTGAPLDVERLQKDLAALYGEGVFDRVIFSVDETGQGKELVVHAIGKETGRNFLRFGLNLETNFQGESLFNLGVLGTRMPVNRLGAELRTRLQVGESTGVELEFYQPLDFGSRFFISPELVFTNGNRNLFVNDERVGELRVKDLKTAIALGWQPSNWLELRVGAGYSKFDSELLIGDPSIPAVGFEGVNAGSRLRIDTLDNTRFPRRGGLLSLEGLWIKETGGNGGAFGLVRLGAGHSFSFGENTISPSIRIGTVWDEGADLPVFSLGGFLRLSGLVPDERAGPNQLFGSVVAYRRIANPRFFTLQLPLYVGGSVEAGNTFDELRDVEASALIVAGSAFLGVDTPLGPLYLAYGIAEGDRHSGYLFLGQRFFSR